MLSAEERAELRLLHAKAYSRDGEMSLEDGARLRELERQRRGVVVVSPDPSTSSGSGLGASVAEPVEVFGGRESVAEPVEVFGDEKRHRPRRYWPVIAAATALLIGLGAGWALWGWNSAESALAIAHSEQRAELEAAGDFDPGTITAVSEQHGVVVWTAKRGEGKEDCVILTTSEVTQSGCGTLDEANLSPANASITVPEGDELEGQMLATFLMRSAAGEVIPAVQVWDNSASGWESQYTEDELETISRIEESEGIEGHTLSILGYDGETAVWRAWGPEGQCVIAEDDAGFIQGCWEEMTPGSELVLIADVRGVPTKYIIRNSARGEQLTVVKMLESAELDSDVGAEINDTTGEIGG